MTHETQIPSIERSILQLRRVGELLTAGLIVVAALFVLAAGDRLGYWDLPFAGTVQTWLVVGMALLAGLRLLVLQRLIQLMERTR